MTIYITKSNGEREPFEEWKLAASLEMSGASEETKNKIISEIKDTLYDGISSEVIYNMANTLLRKKEKGAYLRYNLTNAISLLGPEGFAFEKLLAEIAKKNGYKNVLTGKKIRGKCMTHEMDVTGETDTESLTIEAKFHHSRSKKSDLQVTLR